MDLQAGGSISSYSLVLRLVAELVEILEDRLTKMEVASIDVCSREYSRECRSERLLKISHRHLRIEVRTVGNYGLEGFKVDRNVFVCQQDVDGGDTPGSSMAISLFCVNNE